jgi:SAM-dependent methyltransferase
MLNLISSSDAHRLRNFFGESGYGDEKLAATLGIKDSPSKQPLDPASLLERTREPTRINALLRWFWVGIPQAASAVEDWIPSWLSTLLLECGLLDLDGSQLIPKAMVVPAKGFLFVCDGKSRIDAGDSELVLWPNPTSMLLSLFTVRRPSRATLDLGTGSGIQAIFAASHTQAVVATDLSPRAVSFAAFNARLNGAENVECLVGDALEPVARRKFDLIVSNPPFFITPSTRYLFCDNSLDLDHLCRRLAREAPSHLNEGGYFQMLCEWAEISGQPWRDRIGEWFTNTGCDVCVMRTYVREPSAYARQYAESTLGPTDSRAELYSAHMTYFRERKVTAVHGGMVSMRKRSSQNWIVTEDLRRIPKGPFGESILHRFAARDFLDSHAADHQLLATTLKLSPDARLEQILKQSESGWKSTSMNLKLVAGFEYSMTLQPLVAEFVGRCDGTRSVNDVVGEFAGKVNAPLERVQKECLAVLRKLIERGFVLGERQ